MNAKRAALVQTARPDASERNAPSFARKALEVARRQRGISVSFRDDTGLIDAAGGLVLIVKGGDWIVGAAVRVAELLRMPRAVVGSTLVSLATTTPELVVSIMAATKGEPGLAVGNAVGSCICNIGLILGTTAAIRTVTLQPAALACPLGMMFAVSLALLVFTFDFRLGRAAAGLLLAANIANLTLIVGTAVLLQEVTLERDTHFFHFPVMLSLMGLLFWRLARDRRLSRRDGWVLIGVYAAYLLIVVTVTAFD